MSADLSRHSVLATADLTPLLRSGYVKEPGSTQTLPFGWETTSKSRDDRRDREDDGTVPVQMQQIPQQCSPAGGFAFLTLGPCNSVGFHI
jgi:hypothetical protein